MKKIDITYICDFCGRIEINIADMTNIRKDIPVSAFDVPDDWWENQRNNHICPDCLAKLKEK